MKRAIVIVIDSMGIGAMADHAEFNDVAECNTLKNVCEFNNGLNVPNMQKMGLGNIQDFKGIAKEANPIASYGTMLEKSKGKDTTTGHWEMAGLVSEKPFATFPNGFPQKLVEKFIKETNCGGILANCPASGTAIIEKLNNEHHETKFPIVYTSADSVFQIAVDTDLIESMRSLGYFALDSVDYAIYESNGKLSAVASSGNNENPSSLPILLVKSGKPFDKNMQIVIKGII